MLNARLIFGIFCSNCIQLQQKAALTALHISIVRLSSLLVDMALLLKVTALYSLLRTIDAAYTIQDTYNSGNWFSMFTTEAVSCPVVLVFFPLRLVLMPIRYPIRLMDL